jgi:predicted AlkP superfamily phosphohydrolase/phosphomutase
MVTRLEPRVCVVGLDGVPRDLLHQLAAQGIMPAMQNLIKRGHLRKMKASLPEISSVSWTSFMTGTNPGNHGIFGFTDLRDHSYQIRFPNFLDVKAPTIWDRIGEKGFKSIVINQPSTYPAKKIEGSLVSGFVVIELAKAVYPLSNLAALEKINYQTDIDTEKARNDRQYLWRALDETLAVGRKALEYFYHQDWNYFEFVVTGTDRLQHYAWNAWADPRHSDHSKFLDYYKNVDAVIADIVDRHEKLTGGIESLYMLSDHGFTGIRQEVYLNDFLHKTGYINFDTPHPQQLTDIGPGTRAFALDPNRIYLNTKGRFPRGVVATNEKARLKEEIAAALCNLEYQGRKVVRTVFDTEEIYSGPWAPKGPDLIVLGEHGFDMKGSFRKQVTFGSSDLEGMHTWDDAFFWSAKQHEGDLKISAIAGIIMEHFE